jgi:uncharacterized membrane protein
MKGRMRKDLARMTSSIPISAALAAAISLAIAAAAWAELAQSAAAGDGSEKCYGIVKAGKNDCKTATHACAGWSMVDADPASFLMLPAGTCAKIAGGSLEPTV